jgi:rod shape-determining protein MreC
VAISRRSSRTRYVLLVLVLAAITLVTIDARAGKGGLFGTIRSNTRSVFDPISHATHNALAPVGNFVYGAADYGSLKSENQHLRNQLASAQATTAEAQAAQQQSAAVLAQQHLDFATNVPRFPAQVINQGSSNFESSLEINRGTGQGVAVGDPVVSSGGLVGSVQSASTTRSTVVLLTDPTFNVGVKVDANNVGDVATGAGRGSPLRVTGVQNSAQVSVGQTLTTSGLQFETFPPGIPVGKVTSVNAPAGTLEKTIMVTPLVDTNSLQVVQVLVWSGQTPGNP